MFLQFVDFYGIIYLSKPINMTNMTLQLKSMIFSNLLVSYATS